MLLASQIAYFVGIALMAAGLLMTPLEAKEDATTRRVSITGFVFLLLGFLLYLYV